MRLALTGLFRARWTDAIHEEWMRNVLRNNPHLTRKQLERTRNLMNENVRDCLITGYEDLIDRLTLPDPGDRHVLAAAIQGRADVIVTFNLKHFPAGALKRKRIDAQHPDDFVSRLLDLDPIRVYGAVREQRQALKNPPRTVDELLDTLERLQLPQTVARLRMARALL